jgi:hypothetical protein
LKKRKTLKRRFYKRRKNIEDNHFYRSTYSYETMSLPAEPLSSKHDLKMMNDDAGEVILATAGYDHSIKFWQAHTGACVLTLQHPGVNVVKLFFFVTVA